MKEFKRKYNSDLLKGTGLIQETILLLDIYEPGMTKAELLSSAIQTNIMVKNHSNRIKDIVEHVFYRRYVNQGENVVKSLKEIRQKHLGLEVMSQLLFIYTCRANLILFDFVAFVYQKLAKSRITELPGKAAINFVDEAIKVGLIEKPWAESTKRKVSEHINACMIDFKLIDRKKNILPLYLQDFTVNYLIHELHFKGFSDNAILEADEWQLFGYNKIDVIKHLERISLQGHFIFQSSGEFIKINWYYKNMNEFLDGIR